MHIPPPMPATPLQPPPAPRGKHSNWGPRLLAALLSALAFVGFWLGAQHTAPPTTTSSSSQYAPPSSSGLLPSGGLVPHGSTHVS